MLPGETPPRRIDPLVPPAFERIASVPQTFVRTTIDMSNDMSYGFLMVKRSHRLIVLVTEAEKQKLKDESIKREISLGALIREKLFKEKRK